MTIQEQQVQIRTSMKKLETRIINKQITPNIECSTSILIAQEENYHSIECKEESLAQFLVFQLGNNSGIIQWTEIGIFEGIYTYIYIYI